MKKLTILAILLVSSAFIVPAQASAATNAGVKPGSFFYFFDTASEKINLFFAFNPEKKAQKALEYADERLAEIEAVAGENDSGAVKTAIANYESNVALATKKSREVKDKGQAESLLTSIADNSSRNQEVLSAVLIKVPEEAKAAIAQAIEASKKGQEEATKQIAELKSEVEKLKNEVAELKKESKNPQEDEVEKLKKEVEALKKQGAVQSASKQPTPTTQNSQEQKKIEEKPKTITLPNSEIVEMDASGNNIRTTKEIPPTSTSSSNTSTHASSTASTIPTIVVPTPVPNPAPIVPSIPTPTPTPTPPATTTPTPIPVPPPSQPISIVQDGFDIYTKGTLQGQGGWNSYVNGSNFVVVDTEAFGGTKAIYNQTKADSVITKTGSLLTDGKQAVYVKTAGRTSWGIHSDGNAQVRVSKNPWASGAQGLAFAAVSFKGDGNVAYYDSVADKYKNFATYEDGVWTLLEIEWRSSDKTARYRVNSGGWTDWYTFKNALTFSGFDNVGFDFDLRSGSGGGVYFDSLQ